MAIQLGPSINYNWPPETLKDAVQSLAWWDLDKLISLLFALMREPGHTSHGCHALSIELNSSTVKCDPVNGNTVEEVAVTGVTVVARGAEAWPQERAADGLPELEYIWRIAIGPQGSSVRQSDKGDLEVIFGVPYHNRLDVAVFSQTGPVCVPKGEYPTEARADDILKGVARLIEYEHPVNRRNWLRSLGLWGASPTIELMLGGVNSEQ